MSHPTVHAILTDIEGTTTDIHFVHKVLFPYAYAKLPSFLHENAQAPAVAAQIDAVRDEMHDPTATLEAVIAQLLQWIDTDQKVTPLKALQGMVWADGYQRGDFTGHLYNDVAPVLRRWKSDGKGLYVYSSGSIQAQKLLFGYSDEGDLTSLFSGYFDTHIGHKRDPDAYQRIVAELDLPAQTVLFLSDVVEELDAAEQAGMQTLQLVRKGTQAGHHHACVSRFDEIAI